jgi:hypothetical protein
VVAAGDQIANPVHGADTNEGHALGWARSGNHTSLWDRLEPDELGLDDAELLTSMAWLWVLENTREGERRPSPAFIDALFESSGDFVLVLR